MGHIPNLLADAQPPAIGERFDVLLRQGKLLIERIVSSGDVTPTRCVQAQDEWVMLVQGQATLDVDGHTHQLHTGDHLFLPAGTPHTVMSTASGTVWLAVHLHP
jgi:cupin 2 domain-containing protein